MKDKKHFIHEVVEAREELKRSESLILDGCVELVPLGCFWSASVYLWELWVLSRAAAISCQEAQTRLREKFETKWPRNTLKLAAVVLPSELRQLERAWKHSFCPGVAVSPWTRCCVALKRWTRARVHQKQMHCFKSLINLLPSRPGPARSTCHGSRRQSRHSSGSACSVCLAMPITGRIPTFTICNCSHHWRTQDGVKH